MFDLTDHTNTQSVLLFFDFVMNETKGAGDEEPVTADANQFSMNEMKKNYYGQLFKLREIHPLHDIHILLK
mgnify:CR=1 FL=1